MAQTLYSADVGEGSAQSLYGFVARTSPFSSVRLSFFIPSQWWDVAVPSLSDPLQCNCQILLEEDQHHLLATLSASALASVLLSLPFPRDSSQGRGTSLVLQCAELSGFLAMRCAGSCEMLSLRKAG